MRLLFVCTGNICRSAAAHVLTAAWPDGHLGLTLEARSGGTHAPAGHAVHHFTAAALERRGLDAGGHAARRLSGADVVWADVVLTMTTQHRESVLALDPRSLRKTFTLLEAATLCGDLPPHHLAGVLPEQRGMVLADALAAARARRRGHQAGDIPDPIDGNAKLHARVVDEIAGALRTILLILGRQVGGARHRTIRVDRLPAVPV
jgi:protein-tyrosine phosphatase